MQLAQLNVALGKAGIDDPRMAEFVAALDPVNALAVDESIARLAHLQAHGPTPHAFTFKRRFEAGALAA